MSNQVSPFAALTGAEQQLKWLEYQSIRLPYTQAVSEPEEIAAAEAPVPRQTSAPSAPAPRPAPARESQSAPPAGASAGREAFQRTRHSQYDAVIARMKRAQQQAKAYQTAP